MKKTEYFKLAGLLLSGLIIGCSSESQDKGQSNASDKIQLSGLLLATGLNARSTIFKDTNDNGILDTFEEFARSDDEGFFSYNPNTDINYCESGPENLCLEVFFSSDTETLRSVGGYDSSTGNPVTSTMSREIKLSELLAQTTGSKAFGPVSSKTGQKQSFNNLIISPLTTLFSRIEEDDDATLILANEGLTKDQLDINYLEEKRTNLLNRAIKIQKVIEVAASAVQTHYKAFADHEDLPNDASGFAYDSLLAKLKSDGTTLDDFLSSADALKQVVSDMDEAIKSKVEVINQDEESDPIAKTTRLVDDLPLVVEAIANAGVAINRLVDSVLPDIRVITDPNEQKSVVNLIESLSLVAKEIDQQVEDQNNNTDAYLANLTKTQSILEARNNDGDNAAEVLIKAKLDSLEIVDISTFAKSVSEALDSTSDISTLVDSSVLSSDAKLPISIGETSLLFTRRPSGVETEAGDMAFYFSTDIDGDSDIGEVRTCLRYKEDAVTGTDDSSDSTGVLLTGTWARWDENTILLDLEFANIGRSYFIKSIGELPVDTTKFLYRFDYSGRVKDWLANTANRFEPWLTIPGSNDDCKAQLTDDIGPWPY
ncbi:MAG: hypothetical protein ACI8XC_003847 [Gammaproteobacteria bacterium]|jgi:hypothetical protein